METGLYEQLINRIVSQKLREIEEQFYYKEANLDKEEAAQHLSLYLAGIIQYALKQIKDKDRPGKQIQIANKILNVLISEMPQLKLSGNLLETEGKLLEAVFPKLDFNHTDFKSYVDQITPYTRFSQSELFTGSHAGISLQSELKKEILSSDKICWLVSFIKYSGIRIFKKELEEFTSSGRSFNIITTSYMGATDVKAVEFLSSLPNTEVKVSYNTQQERLHAKAYLFHRNTGFHTGYIGSSNLSKSALTAGVEWNIKVTSQEISHVIDKFQKTFDTYWQDPEFETYTKGKDRDRLAKALKKQSVIKEDFQEAFFDLKPYPFQKEILEKLEVERKVHGRFRNLVVAATGTGKTMISAFDFKRFRQGKTKVNFLFVAHREEILKQARRTFQQVLRDANFGDLWVGGYEPAQRNQLFVSVQTLNKRLKELPLSRGYYDYVIIDEVHHIPANSYRTIVNHFTPEILLGLTATPERSDNKDISTDFDNRIAAEIRLPEALNRQLLSPFHYFGVSDTVDLTEVRWEEGRYSEDELTRLYTEDDRRVGDIIKSCQDYLTDINQVRALGFCVSQEHARYMSEKFSSKGLKAAYLTSENSHQRSALRGKFQKGEINYLFVVDIFNEGVDIPEIDTVLFLRPTESLTIFLQQLGRGLRLAEGKECLTVLDFVGNARPEYDFQQKFRALIGKTHTSIQKEVEDDFPHLPLGCSIVLEQKARETILQNIREATTMRTSALIQRIRHFKHQSTLELTLANFLKFHNLDIRQLYKRGSWKRLCAEAGVISNFKEPHQDELSRAMRLKLINCNSISYLRFIQGLIANDFILDNPSAEEKLMMLMFHYDVWQKAGPEMDFNSLEESLGILSDNPVMLEELSEFLEYLISEIDVVEKDFSFPFPLPLKVHSRYTRDQILAAIQLSSFHQKSSNREGVALNKHLNLEALFITLKKSEKEYSPTTLYQDYALDENLFHWQSQNSTSPESPKGQSYIHHRIRGKRIMLFVREQNKDEFGHNMTYINLGEAEFVSSSGSKPMNIEWRLKEPLPTHLLKESQKLAVG